MLFKNPSYHIYIFRISHGNTHHRVLNIEVKENKKLHRIVIEDNTTSIICRVRADCNSLVYINK